MSKIVDNANDLESITSIDGRIGIGTDPFTDSVFHLRSGNVGLEFSLDHVSGSGLDTARIMAYDRETSTGKNFILAADAIELAGNVTTNGVGLLGHGQSWQSVTRSAGVTYTNTTGKPIMVMIDCYVGASTYVYVIINGISVAYPNSRQNFSFIVPAGHTYLVEQNVTVNRWKELR